MALSARAAGRPGDARGGLGGLQCWLPGSWLFVAVARLARHRFFEPADIDGALRPGSLKARVLQAVAQNTLEQTVLAAIAYGAWLLIPHPALPLATAWAAVACLSVGRVLFFAGYERGAAFRALGFALTFYPTVGLMAVTAWTHLAGRS